MSFPLEETASVLVPAPGFPCRYGRRELLMRRHGQDWDHIELQQEGWKEMPFWSLLIRIPSRRWRFEPHQVEEDLEPQCAYLRQLQSWWRGGSFLLHFRRDVTNTWSVVCLEKAIGTKGQLFAPCVGTHWAVCRGHRYSCTVSGCGVCPPPLLGAWSPELRNSAGWVQGQLCHC